MTKYRTYVLALVVMLFGLAFFPVVVEAFTEKFGWENFAHIYQDIHIYLPLVLR